VSLGLSFLAIFDSDGIALKLTHPSPMGADSTTSTPKVGTPERTNRMPDWSISAASRVIADSDTERCAECAIEHGVRGTVTSSCPWSS
jgi:hypothetical protein